MELSCSIVRASTDMLSLSLVRTSAGASVSTSEAVATAVIVIACRSALLMAAASLAFTLSVELTAAR